VIIYAPYLFCMHRYMYSRYVFHYRHYILVFLNHKKSKGDYFSVAHLNTHTCRISVAHNRCRLETFFRVVYLRHRAQEQMYKYTIWCCASYYMYARNRYAYTTSSIATYYCFTTTSYNIIIILLCVSPYYYFSFLSADAV
jgi:hypothetical protein